MVSRLSVKERTRRERRREPGPRIVYKRFTAKRKPLGDKQLRLLRDGENKADSIH